MMLKADYLIQDPYCLRVRLYTQLKVTVLMLSNMEFVGSSNCLSAKMRRRSPVRAEQKRVFSIIDFLKL